MRMISDYFAVISFLILYLGT